MRLLLAADVDPVSVIGGAERLLAGHASGLAARGHDVVVCSGAPGPAGVQDGYRIARVGRSVRTPGAVAAAVARLRPDAVLGYQPACALGALRAARRRGIGAIYVFSSSWPEEHATRRARPARAAVAARRALEGACLRSSDLVVALSGYSASKVREAHPRIDVPVRLVPGGVDPTRFHPNGGPAAARSRLGLPAQGPLLVTVRNLVPRMGLANLLDAIPLVLRARPGARLVVAGDGAMRCALEAHAARLGLADRVRFPGFVPEEALADYYRAADIVVMPTQHLEGFGLATIEALACGTPVAGTPVGATPEILEPVDPCLVFADSSAEAIADGLLRLLGRPRADLARAAREHVLGHYTWEAVAARLEHVVLEVAP